jgi:ATP-dependent helicase YprA (DUF1998 family)
MICQEERRCPINLTHRDLTAAAWRRLYLLLHELMGDEVVEHSSSTSSKHAEATGLAAFKGGKGSVLVASDAVTRGMDVPGVDVVVNYDTATFPKTYIHRAGRTARAGKEGTACSKLARFLQGSFSVERLIAWPLSNFQQSPLPMKSQPLPIMRRSVYS